MARSPFILLLVLCSVFSGYTQHTLYKDALPDLTSSAHARIASGFLILKNKLDDSTYMQYASYRHFYVSQLKEVMKLYTERSYDRLQYQLNFWNKSIDQDLGNQADMPSIRREQLIARMDIANLDSGQLTASFQEFIKAYTLYQRKVWMRKKNDSTELVTQLYMNRLNLVQEEINRSPEKNKLGDVMGTLRSVKVYQELVDFSFNIRLLIETLKSSKQYLDDEFFYQLTLKEKVNANWKPENIVDLGESLFDAVVSGNQKSYTKHFLSFSEANEIYKKKNANYSQEHYDRAFEQAITTYKQVVGQMKQDNIIPGKIVLVSDYLSNEYMNSITTEQRKTYPTKYDVYILFDSSNGRYLLTLNGVDNSSLKQKVKHLSTLELTRVEGF